MYKNMLSILDFKRLWIFMPIMLFILYIPQTFFGFFVLKNTLVIELAGIMFLGLLTYFLVYIGLSRSAILSSRPDSKRFQFWHISSNHVIAIISICYFTMIFYAVLTSEKIAIWEAFSGATAEDIAYAREALFKNRVGWERLLVYGNAILSSALMPFALVVCYLERRSYRHVLLFGFMVSLLPSMEKVLILKALLPLIMLGINGYFPIRRVVQFFTIAILVIGGAVFFSKMGRVDPISSTQIEIKKLQQQQVELSQVAKLGRDSLAELQLQLEAANKEGGNSQLYAKNVKDLIDQKIEFSKMRAKGREIIVNLNLQLNSLKENEKNDSASVEFTRRSIEKQLLFYKFEQPKQISTMEKSINDELNKYPNHVRGSLVTQIDHYQYEQPRQIAIMERQIREQLEMDFQFVERVQKFNIFGSGQFSFVVNRIFWIPYVTAYDWLGFFHNKLSGEYLLGRTSGLIGLITGRPNFPMEGEVFNYQYGGVVLTTAAANASFLVDAFVNFGWIGVVIYAAIFALLTRIVVVQGNPAMMSCYYYFVFQVSMGGLSGVLFSNGMIVLICVAFFVRPKLNLVAH